MKRTVLMAAVILFSVTIVFADGSNNGIPKSDTTREAKNPKVIYTCPMHTDLVVYKPGKCPKPGCGMTLVKKSDLKKKPAVK